MDRTALLEERVALVLDERTDDDEDDARTGVDVLVERTVEVALAGCVRVAVLAAAARLVAVLVVVARVAEDVRLGLVAFTRVEVVLALRVAVAVVLALRVAVVPALRLDEPTVRVELAAERVLLLP